MLLSIKASISCRVAHTCYLLLTDFNMPKYAVAAGRKIGIYDTYEECKMQIINYPNAKFKKFNTEAEAAEFIKKVSNVTLSVQQLTCTKPSNISEIDIIKVEKISPSNTTLHSLNSRLTMVEQKLNNFITNTTDMFEGLASRITSLEGRLKRSRSVELIASANGPNKKPKPDEKTDVGNFLYTDTGSVIVYTDGACSKNGRTGAMAGIGVWFNVDHPLNISAPVKGPPTNNTAEIQAARVAIKQAARAGVNKLTIYTDSQFLINCITQWIHKWKKNDWKLSSGGTVKNKEELIKLDNAIKSIESVEWIHVQGHGGILGNEMADSLARNGAAQYKTNVTYGTSADKDDDND